MHPELNSTLEKRQSLIEKMNSSAAFDPKAYEQLQDLQKRIELMESHPGPEFEPEPGQPILDLEAPAKPKRAAKL